MCSIDDKNPPNQTIPNSIVDSDAETQSPSSDSGSEEELEPIDWDLNGETVPLGGETQLLNFDDETQVLDYLECDGENVMTELLDDGNVRTQLLEEANARTQLLDDESDGGGTDRTEVLSDCGTDGGFWKDGTGTEMVAACSGDEQGGVEYVVDSDASADDADWDGPGFVQRNLMSVCGASFRDSGQAASTTTPKETKDEAGSFPDNVMSGKKHLDKDDGMDVLKDPFSVGIEVTKAYQDSNLQNCDGKLTGYNDKTKYEGAKSFTRKLFNEDGFIGKNGLVNDNEGYDGAGEPPESPTDDHKFAGLSYVGSQEPGEFSQANALDVVDRFLAVSHVEIFKEDECCKTLKELSPPVSRAKGTQTLAKNSGIKRPVRDAEIFNWIDNCEDESCKCVSDKRTGTPIRSRCHGQKSLTQGQKPKHLQSSKGRCISNKHKDDNLKFQKKTVRTSKRNVEVMKTSEECIMKNLSKDFSEQLTARSPEKPLEGARSGMDLPDAYDIGFDTQMAAEAMEALCCGVLPNQEADNLSKLSENIACVSPRALTNNETFTNHVYVRKRVSSGSGCTARRSKRTRKIDTKVDNANCMLAKKELKGPQKEGPRPVSMVKKKSKSKAEEHPSNRISIDGKEEMGCGLSKSVVHRKTTGAIEKLNKKVLDRCDSLSLLNDNLEVSERWVQEDFGSFTPIACRTRQSKAVNPMAEMVSSTGSGKKIYSTNDRSHRVKRRGYHPGVDAQETSTCRGNNKAGPSQIAKARKGKLIQLEPIDGAQGERATNQKCGTSYSRVKRTCRNISVCLNDSNLNGPSSVGCGQYVNEQHIPRGKRSKIIRGSAKSKSFVEWGKKVDASIVSFPGGPKRDNRLEVILGDKTKLVSTSCITLVNCTVAIETPSPICLGQKNSSLKKTPIPDSKELRRMRDMADVRVLLSQHLDEDVVKQQKKISSRLGLPIVSSLSEATHFIANKFVRTRNMLEAIAFGKPVVTHLWLESCVKANSLVDEKNYILRDSDKENEIGFSMPVSLERARACHSGLLQGKSVFVTPNVKPSRELVASLVTTVQGQVVKRIGRSSMNKISGDLLVLSCEEDYATCLPLLLKRAAVYSSELLLNGIIIQKLEYERHRLFKDHTKMTD